jgi:hypothetical protein
MRRLPELHRIKYLAICISFGDSDSDAPIGVRLALTGILLVV